MTARDLLAKGFVERKDGSFEKAVVVNGQVKLEHVESKAVERERDLHEEIIAYCNAQNPRWKYIHARMDQRSTIEIGAPDFVIFLPAGKFLVLECKRKGGKYTPEQLGWALQMTLLGHTVHVIHNSQEFLALANRGGTFPFS